MVNFEDQTQWCGVVTFHIEGTDPEKLANWLFDKHRIFVVAIIHNEFKGLRISPNVYTRISEIDFFSEIMEKVAKGDIQEVLG